MASNARSIIRLYINNLPWTVTSREVCDYFSKFGDIKRGAVYFNKDTGLSTGCGYIDVKDNETLKKIIRARSHNIEGNTLVTTTQLETYRKFNNCIEI